ncbi:MAG TPA: hypothetical protein VK021_13275 [Flavobacteriaceae bacterium]|nr:hypothetical protein [Flavobacteriaceae bacterium]
MNPQNFNRILSMDVEPDLQRTKELTAIVEKYPYFQAARALHLKGLYQHGSFLYNSALKQTAAYTTDRSVLFDYITSDEFRQHHISKRIKVRSEKELQQEMEEAELMPMEDAERVLDPGLFEESKEEDKAAKTQKQETNLVEDAKKKGLEEPVDFDDKRERSFSEWLKLTKAKPIKRPEEKVAEKSNKKVEEAPKTPPEYDLIDRFIKNDPKITPGKKAKPQISLKDYEPESPLMTETLARIYAEQKNYSKAIQAYKILILKNPEKSGFFADRIHELENLIENKNK